MSNPFLQEEKYEGPLLHGAPEMIVSSGALGMTGERPRNVPWTGTNSQKNKMFDGAFQSKTKSLPPLNVRKKKGVPSPATDMPHLDAMDEKYNGPLYHHESSSSAGPSPSNSGLPFHTQVTILPSRARKRKVPDTDTISESLRSFVQPEITEEERLELERQEKERHRHKEIGRRICELDLTDFTPDKIKNDRKTFMIATRAEEILASAHRNLTVIQSKLGEYAVGTIFEDVDKLTKSFGNASPNVLNRLNQIVAEKLRLRAEATAALLELSSFGQMPLDLKAEELQESVVKLEEPDDYSY